MKVYFYWWWTDDTDTLHVTTLQNNHRLKQDPYYHQSTKQGLLHFHSYNRIPQPQTTTAWSSLEREGTPGGRLGFKFSRRTWVTQWSPANQAQKKRKTVGETIRISLALPPTRLGVTTHQSWVFLTAERVTHPPPPGLCDRWPNKDESELGDLWLSVWTLSLGIHSEKKLRLARSKWMLHSTYIPNFSTHGDKGLPQVIEEDWKSDNLW